MRTVAFGRASAGGVFTTGEAGGGVRTGVIDGGGVVGSGEERTSLMGANVVVVCDRGGVFTALSALSRTKVGTWNAGLPDVIGESKGPLFASSGLVVAIGFILLA